LTLMKGLDAIARELQSGQRLTVTGLFSFCDFLGCYMQTNLGEIDAIKPGGKLEQRSIATRCHVGNDSAHRLLDVLRRFTLDRKKAAKTIGEIRALTV